MNKFPRLLFLLCVLLSSCKEKKKANGDDENFIPVISYLKGQVAQMDSSLATIIKIEKQEGKQPDTAYLRREEFKVYAKEFTDLPDISSEQIKDDYTVTSMHDDLLNAFVFTYTTTEEDHIIKKQDVIVEPGEDGNSNIKAVNIEKWQKVRDSTVQKNMLWESNKRFLIISKIQKLSQPEIIKTLEVKWSSAPGGF